MVNLTVLILFTRQPKFDVILWLMNKVILESFLMICTNHCPLLCSNVRYLCMFPHDLPFFLLFPFAFHSFRSMYSVCFACAGRIVYFCYSNHFIFLYRCYAFAKFFVRLLFSWSFTSWYCKYMYNNLLHSTFCCLIKHIWFYTHIMSFLFECPFA